MPDLLFSTGDSNKGVFSSRSVSAAEYIRFDILKTKRKQYNRLITLLNLANMWPKCLVIPTYLAVQNKKINLFSLLSKNIGEFCACIMPLATMSFSEEDVF